MNKLEWIDRYLDRALPTDEAIGLEQTLQTDADLRDLFDRVLLARDAVRSSALRSRVRELHFQLIDEIGQQEGTIGWENEDVVVKPLRYSQPWRWGARIAASGLLMMLGYGGYQFATTTTNSMVSDKLIGYQLPNARGRVDLSTSLDAYYRNSNFKSVTQVYQSLSAPSARDRFLAGMAYLQLQDYDQAAAVFEDLQQQNSQADKPLFDQESDYYLALAYLGDQRVEDAYPLFEKIKNTPRHLYHQNVTEQDLIKLKLLRWKK